MRHSKGLVCLILAGLAMLAGACAPRVSVEPADLVMNNGKIVTVDEARPEAQAIAVRGDRIVAVGSEEEVRPHIGPETRVINLGGKLAIPGFIESHAHFTSIGRARMTLNLMDAESWDEIVAMVAEAVKSAQPGEWIVGRGWHQEKWSSTPTPNVGGFPVHDLLSRVSPNNPVHLTHASGHASFANAKAMELAGVTRATKNPPGGEVLKDARGNPIGAFTETASGLINRVMARSRAGRTPEEIEADARKEIELADREVLSKGITTLHDAGTSFSTAKRFIQMAEEGRLGVRLYVMLSESNDVLARRLPEYKVIGAAGNRVTVRSIKRLIDGALGPRGAWLLEPYRDMSDTAGLNTEPVEEIAETARLAIENGFQLAVHAIGDRANRETLDIYEAAFAAHPDKKDLRWRIEHAQHLSVTDIPRFGKLGVIAAMQGIHCTSDAPYVLARLGRERAETGAYVWQKLMKTGAVVSNGTDAPVEDVDALASYYATVSRRLKDGSVFFSDERMSRMEALRSYTINGAYSAFEEELKGTLTPGKLADIVVLSQDILTVPEDEIPATQVLYTIVGGKVLYQKQLELTTR
jgi:predicted amidohydrolase YtcJ